MTNMRRVPSLGRSLCRFEILAVSSEADVGHGDDKIEVSFRHSFSGVMNKVVAPQVADTGHLRKRIAVIQMAEHVNYLHE